MPANLPSRTKAPGQGIPVIFGLSIYKSDFHVSLSGTFTETEMNMLDQLLKTIVSQGQQQVVENPAIPNELNQQVIGEAGNSIFDGLQGALAGGGLSQIMQLFSGGGQQGQGAGLASLLSNPLVQNIVQSFTGKLTNQYNLSPEAATQVGNQLIPDVLSRFGQQVSDPNDSSIDINGVIQSLTGGKAGGFDFGSLASRFASGGMGKDVDGDGDVDLQDIIASVSGAASNARGNSGGGGIMDMIGQLMR
jgi:hypothetical protein